MSEKASPAKGDLKKTPHFGKNESPTTFWPIPYSTLSREILNSQSHHPNGYRGHDSMNFPANTALEQFRICARRFHDGESPLKGGTLQFHDATVTNVPESSKSLNYPVTTDSSEKPHEDRGDLQANREAPKGLSAGVQGKEN